MTKSYSISKEEILEAYKAVRKNNGAAGIDGQTIKDFDEKLEDNLYKIWNRMSSGSYFPPPVKQVDIPKEKGVRKLGIPTVADRTAQMVVKRRIESKIDKIFYEESYAYRPGKSALEAVGIARERCWKYNWVLDLDIKGFFDNIDHDLLMKAVKVHVKEKWRILYIERWIKCPIQIRDGEIKERSKGIPQGGVISPLLANLFLHYAFDRWMKTNYLGIPFERYADDIICHCKSLEQAMFIQGKIEKRLEGCKLELNREKTKIVYCKDAKRQQDYLNTKFDFLGYEFRPRLSKSKKNRFFANFTPAISTKARNEMRKTIRKWKVHLWTNKTLKDIAQDVNEIFSGWINYYGKYYKSALYPVLNQFNRILENWTKRKYKGWGKWKADKWLQGVKENNPKLFVHWNLSQKTG